jgi:hypothetical protein
VDKENDLRRRSGTFTYTGKPNELAMIEDEPVEKSILGTEQDELESAARAYMNACGLNPTPDAVGQLAEVFLPCLKIMCERPWDPNGATWRKSGWLGIMTDVRKKFERLWERAWQHGVRHDDSILDLINYLGFLRRSKKSRWGDWGEPYSGPEE